MKDHELAKLTNELRDVAKVFHGAQQLRSRIAAVLGKFIITDEGYARLDHRSGTCMENNRSVT